MVDVKRIVVLKISIVIITLGVFVYGWIGGNMLNLVRPFSRESIIVSGSDGWEYYGSMALLFLAVLVGARELFLDYKKMRRKD